MSRAVRVGGTFAVTTLVAVAVGRFTVFGRVTFFLDCVADLAAGFLTGFCLGLADGFEAVGFLPPKSLLLLPRSWPETKAVANSVNAAPKIDLFSIKLNISNSFFLTWLDQSKAKILLFLVRRNINSE